MKNRFWTGLGGVLMGVGILGIVLTAYAANERLKTDGRGNAAMGAITNDAFKELRNLLVDPTTGELLVKASTTAPVGGATSANQALILTQVTTSQTGAEPFVVTIGTTPTLILSADSTRRGATIQNMGTSIVFLGKGAVTTSTGLGLAGGTVANNAKGAIAITEDGDLLFGVVASGTVLVRVRPVSE